MNKKKAFKLCVIILLGLFFSFKAFSNIRIVTIVDDEIITNYDVLKEINYLKILNSNLNNLDEIKLAKLGEQSLINEIIKRKEINKYINIYDDNFYNASYLDNLINRLNYKDENEFKIDLARKNSYTIDEIKLKIKIEILWNDLILSNYQNKIRINKAKIANKIDTYKTNNIKNYSLSEIVFQKNKDVSLEELINKIKKSIQEIGFNNTANIYSLSETSKFGGKIGWVDEKSLSEELVDKINKLNIGEYSDVIKIGNIFLILKIEDIKILENKIDRDKEIEKLIEIETKKKLTMYSTIYFNKIKKNYKIDEK
jgi:peptidyl-prolyl cis-trans isomerase SurA